MKEREEAKAILEGSPEKVESKHSESRKKKCPNCPISFVFQVHPCHSYITVSDKVCGIVDDIDFEFYLGRSVCSHGDLSLKESWAQVLQLIHTYVNDILCRLWFPISFVQCYGLFIVRTRSSSEEGGRSESEQILESMDSKENRELVDKIKDFNKASQLLKRKSTGGSAPEVKKQEVSDEKIKVTNDGSVCVTSLYRG